MYEQDEPTTLAVKPCGSCGAGIIEASRFCRSCGARQTSSLPLHAPNTIAAFEREPLRNYETTSLAKQNLYHPVSGPLVRAVAAGVPTNGPRSITGSFSRRMLLALMAIPIWVMIILLSPIDAYASAKIIGNRI